jgi:imidazolonepropionase-like amidohydrolase
MPFARPLTQPSPRLAGIAVCILAGAPADGVDIVADAGARGGRGLAIRAAKALCCELEGRQVVDGALLLVRDGEIEAVGSADDIDIPAGYALMDVGESWLVPGMVDLHSHVGGSGINDMVLQVNPGLRVAATLRPDNAALQRALAGGVTTVLFIPGSGTNIGGQGILVKTGPGTYDEVCVRNPGSLKVAQGDNPKRWGYGMGRLLMNHHIRTTLRRGLAYARRWEDYEREGGEEPERRLDLDIFRALAAKETQISTHTQYYQVVLASLRILRMEFGFDAYIDHGSFDSWELGAVAENIGVPAILGPREVLWPRPPRYDTDGRVEASSWGFQRMGHTRIGFNTDAPVVPQEELPLQAAMGVRYGFDDSHVDAVRAVTIVPAWTAGIDERLGSLEVGKDADILVVGGDPTDPRNAIERVLVEGRVVYEERKGAQRW